MDASGFERVEIQGHGGDQGLAFAGDHFGNVALVEDEGAEYLYVEGAQAEDALCGFAYGGEGLGKQVIQGLAVREAGPE